MRYTPPSRCQGCSSLGIPDSLCQHVLEVRWPGSTTAHKFVPESRELVVKLADGKISSTISLVTDLSNREFLYVCVGFMVLITAMFLCTRSVNSLLSATLRREHVVFSTAGFKGGGKREKSVPEFKQAIFIE